MFDGVSVCIFSYNYEKYIGSAIESVLSQVTSFPVEIVIGDDCSTDSTRSIASRYGALHPDKVRLSYNSENIGAVRNWVNTMKQCSGKYIAFLDGDDYFLDAGKLQKQYDLLEANKDANLAFHGVREVYENKNFIQKDVVFSADEYSTADLLSQGWFIRTSSLFFRNGILLQQLQPWVYDFPFRQDSIFIVQLSLGSKALNTKDVMTVWRRHNAGMSYAITKDGVKNYVTEKALYEHLDAYTGYRYSNEIALYIRRVRTKLVFSFLKSLKLSGLGSIALRELRDIDFRLIREMLIHSIKTKLKKEDAR